MSKSIMADRVQHEIMQRPKRGRRSMSDAAWLTDKPEWCEPLVWLKHVWYSLVDDRAPWWEVNLAMAKARGRGDLFGNWKRR